jgi:serine/threonine protein kinase
MQTARWQKLKDIFNSALEHSDSDREKYLAEVCGPDKNLRHEIDILLHSYDSGFMEAPILSKVVNEYSTEFAIAKIGEKFNHYQILEKLGRGGMGEVYLAEDTKLYRKVAIKFLKFSSEKAERHLRREARAAASLNHPNICTIYEIGEHNNRSFIVMEYIEGETLERVIKENKLDLRKIVPIAISIAEALAEAHSRGLIHRDIKPSNVIITPKDQIKVLDFGLAKKTLFGENESEFSLVSNIGIIAGTISYMSPEQARGLEIDTRSDIWSLGVVLYEMLTLKLPFYGETKSDVIASILQKDFLPLSYSVQNIPAKAEEVINNSLQKIRAERYLEVLDLLSDLRALVPLLESDQSIKRIEGPSQKSVQTAQRINTERLKSKADLNSVYSTDLEFRKVTDDSLRKSAFDLVSVTLKNNWITTLGLFFGLIIIFSALWIVRSNNQNVSAVSPDLIGKYQIAPLMRPEAKPDGIISNISFSPDSKYILFSVNNDGASSVFVKLADGDGLVQITDPQLNAQSPIWSPDGMRVAFFSNQNQKPGIWNVSYLGGVPVLQLTPQTDSPYFLTKWSNDGNSIYAESNGKLVKIDLMTGQISEFITPQFKVNGKMSLAADEQKIAFSTIENQTERVWVQTIGSNRAQLISNINYRSWSPAWFPDSNEVAFTSNESGNFQINVFDLSKQKSNQITFNKFDSDTPTISPNGLRIVYLSQSNFDNN